MLIVSARFDRQQYRGTQFLWRIRSSDGERRRVTIGEQGMEREFRVLDIAFDGDEPARIISREGGITIPASPGGTEQ